MVDSSALSSLSILVGSFNLHKLHPPADLDLSPWLRHRSSSSPHIVAVGLQELPGIFPFLQQKSEYKWQTLLSRTLSNYQLLARVRLNGIILFIYVQSAHVNQCSSVASARVSTGFFNLYGNKGGVGIRFQFDRTSLCFINCHLTAGESLEAFKRRNDDYLLIAQRLMFWSKSQKWTIDEHDACFLFGDLNYRVSEQQEDEVTRARDLMKNYRESQIRFAPSYKLKINSHDYDQSRRPSWTDRILYKSQNCQIESTDYWSTSTICFSDHRPVAGLFLLSRFLHRL